MKKTIVILIICFAIFLPGCVPFVLSTADTIGINGEEPLHIRMAAPIPKPTYETCSAVDQSYIDEVLELTNKERAKEDLPELTLSPTLSQIADLRAVDMAENGYFEHTSPTGETAFGLLQKYQVFHFNSAENIGRGDVPGKSMVNAWMNSSEHRKIILSKTYHQLGIGIAEAENGELYWVQIFIN